MTKEELIIYAIRTSEAIKEEKKQELIDYVSNLQQENQELKEDISFCLHSIKQEMEMSTDSRTRSEMTSCYEILKR